VGVRSGAPTPRSLATRARLIGAAERLFAERSIEAVSLNEISKAAGQRNSSVCQYHFRNKQGLLRAILDKHVPGIATAREALLEQLRRSGRPPGLRALVRAFVQPVAAKLHDADGGREFVRINAQLIALYTLSVQGVPVSPLKLGLHADRFFEELRRVLRAAGIPEAVVQQRLMLAAVLVFHGLDDHVRMLDAASRRAATRGTTLFIANLEDSLVALLSAPMPAARRALNR